MKNIVIGLVSILVLLVITIIGIDIYNGVKGYKVQPKAAKVAIEKLEDKEDYLLVIGSSTCGYCIDYKKEPLAEYLKNDSEYDLVYVELDKNSQSDMQEIYSVTGAVNSTPTTFLIIDGQVKEKIAGYLDYDQLTAFIKDNE